MIEKYGGEENFYATIVRSKRKYTVGEIFKDLLKLQDSYRNAKFGWCWIIKEYIYTR